MYYIYMMRSTECRHKCYIGLTKAPRNRLKSHLAVEKQKWKNLTKFGRAVKRYGADTFTMKILERTPDIDEAMELESKWIKHFGPKKLWNSTKVGGAYSGKHGKRMSPTRRARETRRKRGEKVRRRMRSARGKSFKDGNKRR